MCEKYWNNRSDDRAVGAKRKNERHVRSITENDKYIYTYLYILIQFTAKNKRRI